MTVQTFIPMVPKLPQKTLLPSHSTPQPSMDQLKNCISKRKGVR